VSEQFLVDQKVVVELGEGNLASAQERLKIVVVYV
jgi:hypothetical protein